MILAAGVIGSMPSTATATQAVAVDLGRVDVSDELRAGERYTLPTLRVTNRGTETGWFAAAIEPIAGKESAPAEWFRLDPERFELAPGASQPVSVVLVLPPDASPVRYEQLLAGQIVVDPSGGGVSVGAAAASILTFEVVPSSIWGGLWRSMSSFFAAGHPWSTVVVSGAALYFAGSWVARNFELAVRRK